MLQSSPAAAAVFFFFFFPPPIETREWSLVMNNIKLLSEGLKKSCVRGVPSLPDFKRSTHLRTGHHIVKKAVLRDDKDVRNRGKC